MSDLKTRMRIATLYGDADLLLSIYYSDFWKQLFSGGSQTLWILLSGFGKFARELTVLPVRMLLRWRPGDRAVGGIVLFFSVSMLVAFNSQHLFSFLAPVSAFFVWLVPLIPDTVSYHELAFLDVRSYPLLIFTGLFAFCGTVQIGGIYGVGWFNAQDRGKRGDSIFYLLLRRIVPIGESVVQLWIEPTMVCAVAAYFIWYDYDLTAALYFSSAGLLLFFQELLDSLNRRVMPH